MSTLVAPALKEIIQQANSIYVLVPQQNTFDTFAAGLALYQSLKQAGKSVFIASPAQPKDSYLQLPGAQAVSTEVGNRNLVITLQLNSHEDIDKVSYHVNEEENTFNLVIQPKADVDPIAKDNINYSYTGADADVVFMVGGQRFEDYGHFYELERKLFTDTQTVAINRVSSGSFTSHQVTDPDSSSLAETIYTLVNELDFGALSGETATVIMAGMDFATNQLQSPVIRPETFETVAQLMRAGARRGIAPASAPAMPTTPFNMPSSPFGVSPMGTSPMMRPTMPGSNGFGVQMPQPMPAMQPAQMPQVQPQVQAQPQQQSKPKGNQQGGQSKQQGQKQPKQHQPQPGSQGRLS